MAQKGWHTVTLPDSLLEEVKGDPGEGYHGVQNEIRVHKGSHPSEDYRP